MKTEKKYCYHCRQEQEFQILEKGDSLVAWGSSHVVAWGSSHVVAWGSSHVEAWGSSHVEARGSSHVVARESSHVEAWGSSHVEAWGSSHVVAWGSSHVVASKYNSVTIHGQKVHAKGGIQIKIPDIFTAKEWCDFYGAEVKKGVAILFKGVGDDYKSPYGISYVPGTIPVAPDWDGGKLECGGGLHFSPSPAHTLQFNTDATKFVACPVRVKDIVVHKDAQYPSKIKAKGCCAPVWEVDREGKPIK